MAIKINAVLEKRTLNFAKYKMDKDDNKYGIFGFVYLPLDKGKKPIKNLTIKIRKADEK